MTLSTKISTWMNGQYVGKDRYGNRYYQSRLPSTHPKRRRWVMYQGLPEPSKVPPEWFGWLHYSEDQPLRSEPNAHLDAKSGSQTERPHSALNYQPNFSGTKWAWRPPGSVVAGGHRPAATGDYQAWQPAAPLVLDQKK
ncbi:MAG: NADH-ubiquinone oxidoreductase subunit NDUFA12 family protein [Candidatus Symbiobacter sp.]|nr:NADH-ubiquinone oxidoreductase subunit NDUFA12 family protein [Candidatus Symbiobacter sp.]